MKNISYQTGLESYNERGDIDIEGSIDLINQRMIERDQEKYEAFLGSLKKTKLIWLLMRGPNIKKRHKLLTYIYYWMRTEDDIWDNDTPLTLDIETKEKIMKKHEEGSFFSNSLCCYFYNEVNKLSQELGIEEVVMNGIQKIRESIQRDGKRAIIFEKRINEGIDPWDALVKVNKQDIQENFYKCDIEGTVFPTGRLFGIIGDAENKINLIKIGTSSRIIYTVRDILTEPKDGLLHIPIEDLKKYRIEKHNGEKLLSAERYIDLPGNVIERLKDETKQALDHYHEYKKAIKNTTFTFEGRTSGIKTNKTQNFINNGILKKIVLRKGYEEEILKWVDKINKL